MSVERSVGFSRGASRMGNASWRSQASSEDTDSSLPGDLDDDYSGKMPTRCPDELDCRCVLGKKMEMNVAHTSMWQKLEILFSPDGNTRKQTLLCHFTQAA